MDGFLWIYDHPDWHRFIREPQSFCSGDHQLLPMLTALRRRVGELRHKVRTINDTDNTDDLAIHFEREIFTDNLVKSWLIEGEFLDADEVRASYAKHRGLSTFRHKSPSSYMDQLTAVMDNAITHHSEPMDENLLFHWHKTIFSDKGPQSKGPVGVWREDAHGPMRIVSGAAMGREKVHFVAPSAKRVPEEMRAFLSWCEEDRADLDPILKAGVAHFWFEVIHPFCDGNGRIGRIICDRMLARAHNASTLYYSFAVAVEQDRKGYYDQLKSHSAQKRGQIDLTGWILWFVTALERAMDHSEEMWCYTLSLGRFWNEYSCLFNERQRVVLWRMLDKSFEGHLDVKKYAKLAKCSDSQAQEDINHLKALDLLYKEEPQHKGYQLKFDRQ